MRQIVLTEDEYSFSQAEMNYPNHERILVKDNLNKTYEKLKKDSSVFIYRTTRSNPFPHKNFVGKMNSRRLHSYMS